MIRNILIALLFLSFHLSIFSQEIEELYQKGDFEALIKFADKTEDLSNEELYYIGHAFFQLEDDPNAIKMYDKAIENGLDEDYVYLYKGLALRYNKQLDESLKFFELAVEKNPHSQKNVTELGNCYYFQEKLDEALPHFIKARELDYELGDPYIKIPIIYAAKEEFDKALEEYKTSAQMIPKQDPTYLELLVQIGAIEYSIFENYDNAKNAFSEIIEKTPDFYDIYPDLIKTHYALGEYEKGDELFEILKEKYEAKELSEDFMKYKNTPIAGFKWNGQTVAVYKNFEEPKELLDIMYKVYLIGKDGRTIERTMMTEKTIQFEEDGAKHVFCESPKNGGHITYPVGWNTDDIPFESLKETILSVLNEEIKFGAASNLGSEPSSEKSKKKKKRKKNK